MNKQVDVKINKTVQIGGKEFDTETVTDFFIIYKN